jgi:hypothetical protein
MKNKYGFVLIALILFGFVTPSSATFISDPWQLSNLNDEQNVYEVYNFLYNTSYGSSNDLPQVSDSLDNLWTETNGKVRVEVRYAGYGQELGYFYNGSYTPLINAISNAIYNYTIVDINVPNGGPFSWVDRAVDETTKDTWTWYSNDLLNSDHMDHFIAFTTPNAGEYILAFEDWPGDLGDKDYNDLIVKVTQVAPVPEPSTLLLVGAGIIGVCLTRKRFRK